MAHEFTVTLGSGTIPHVQSSPVLDLDDGAYPVPKIAENLNSRTGTGAVILNPEDFSVHVDVRAQSITVGASATPLPASPLEYRRALLIHNAGNTDIFIGDSTVTTGNGMPLSSGEKVAFDIGGNPNVTIYAIAATDTDVRILELS